MTRAPDLLLRDIRDSIDLIERYLNGVKQGTFETDVQLQDSVIRRLEIIGEAVKSLPRSFREAHPRVRWREIAGLRDVLIHQYARVDLALTWTTISEEIPVLKTQIEEILRGDGDGNFSPL